MYFIWEGAEKVFPLRRIWEGFYWCRTYTPFEKELRRYFHLRRLNIFQHFDLRRHWEGFLFEKDLRSMELLQSSWDGFEKVRWIWEGNVPSLFFHLKVYSMYIMKSNLLIIQRPYLILRILHLWHPNYQLWTVQIISIIWWLYRIFVQELILIVIPAIIVWQQTVIFSSNFLFFID